MKSITLSNVSVRFGQVQALDDVSVQVRAGEVVMLAGPNGAGKSTLIQVLLGLVRQNAGKLSVDGQTRTVDNVFKSKLGYLPEAVAFSDNLTGRQVLRFFASARGVSYRRVDAILEQVGLTAAARRPIQGYSRGMRQRLGLGLSILSEPELLILDEPTGGLDQQGLNLLWEILEEWKNAGRMVLLSSHDLALLERRIDRVCLLCEGRVRAMNTPTALREAVALPVRVTFKLSDDSDAVRALKDHFAGLLDAAPIFENDSSITLQVAPARLLEVLELPARHRAAISAVRVEEPGLDTIYDYLLKNPEEVIWAA
ncbi:MAG: ABC transporter ATP-binding protein [Bradymonadaceae bacterium]